MTHPPLDRKGLAITVGTFLIWGVVPLYWHLLKAVPSFHIIAHRIVWSAVLVLGWLLLKNGLGWWRQIRAQPRAVPLLGVSSLLIAFNVVSLSNNFVASIWQSLNMILDPMLKPIRKIMPDTGMIDFSPIVLIIGLRIIQMLLGGLYSDLYMSGAL